MLYISTYFFLFENPSDSADFAIVYHVLNNSFVFICILYTFFPV